MTGLNATTPASPAPPRGRLFLYAFVATVAVRLACAFSQQVMPLQPDFAEYAALAHELQTHGEFGFGDGWQRDAELRISFQAFMYEPHQARFRTPGFPALLAVLEATGGGTRALQFVLALCDGFVAVLIAYVGLALWNLGVARLAVAAWALNPGANYLMTKLAREELLSLGLLTIVVLTWRLAEKANRREALLLGVATAATAYFKETALPVLVACLMWLTWRTWHTQRKLPLVTLAWTGLATLLGLLPWLVRNSFIAGKPVGLSTMGPVAAYLGLLPAHHGLAGANPATEAALAPYTAPSADRAAERASALVESYTRSHPQEVLQHALDNIGWFWSPVTRWQEPGAELSLAQWAVGALYVLLFAAALCGMWLERRKPWTTLTLWLLVCATVMHAPSLSVPRYRIPFEPLLVLMAAAAMQRVRVPRCVG